MKETNMISLLTIIATQPELLMVMLTYADKHYKILVCTSYSEGFRFKSWPWWLVIFTKFPVVSLNPSCRIQWK